MSERHLNFIVALLLPEFYFKIVILSVIPSAEVVKQTAPLVLSTKAMSSLLSLNSLGGGAFPENNNLFQYARKAAGDFLSTEL